MNDNVAIMIKRWRKTDIQKVNELTSVNIDEEPLSGSFWKGFRFIGFSTQGQAGRRYIQTQAAYRSLNKDCKKIFTNNECIVAVYYQMD